MDKYRFDGMPLSDLVSGSIGDTSVVQFYNNYTTLSGFTKDNQGIQVTETPVNKKFLRVGRETNLFPYTTGTNKEPLKVYAKSHIFAGDQSGGNKINYTLNQVGGFNKISGVLIGGTYGGGGGGGGTEYARGGKGGPGGSSEVLTFHGIDLAGCNTISVEIGARGNGGSGSSGTNNGNAEDGDVSNWQQGNGESKVWRNTTRTSSNLILTANTGGRGAGGYGNNQGEQGPASAKAPGSSAPARMKGISLPYGDNAITINSTRGSGGNGGDGGGNQGGDGGGGQSGQVGYGMIFLQKV